MKNDLSNKMGSIIFHFLNESLKYKTSNDLQSIYDYKIHIFIFYGINIPSFECQEYQDAIMGVIFCVKCFPALLPRSV